MQEKSGKQDGGGCFPLRARSLLIERSAPEIKVQAVPVLCGWNMCLNRHLRCCNDPPRRTISSTAPNGFNSWPAVSADTLPRRLAVAVNRGDSCSRRSLKWQHIISRSSWALSPCRPLIFLLSLLQAAVNVAVSSDGSLKPPSGRKRKHPLQLRDTSVSTYC